MIKKLLYLLSTGEQKKMYLLFVMMLSMALIDMIGVASIMPFIAVLSNPEIIHTNHLIQFIFRYSGQFGIETEQQFFFFLGILVLFLLILSLSFKALTLFFQFKFTQMREYSIGKRLIESYLHQPYSWFLNHHSADLGKTILSEVRSVVASGISPMINLISNSIVAIILLALLIVINPKLALIAGFTLTLAYALLYKTVRSFLNKIGKETVIDDSSRFKAVSESFGAAKEIKLGGFEKVYIDRFAKSAKNYSRNQANTKIIALLPRFGLEAIAFGGIILVVLSLLSDSGTLNNVLPVIALYVFAGYRLMPALQQIYASLAALRFVGPSLDSVCRNFEKLENNPPLNEKNNILLKNKIILKNINYNYPSSKKNILRNINITIPAQKRIGIVGKTGSGKTTLIDIILGLLDTRSGYLKIDDKIINTENQKLWQKSIGYVPQKIYLTDDTIAANIAFGVDAKNIDLDKIIEASKIANLHEFVLNELPLKYETRIGERGIRLSGGQSQRIGIARALYHETNLLVFDEATSALDYHTEKSVMEALNKISKDRTIIIIAHRLNTIMECDKIFFLEKGEIKGEGRYDELINTNNSFKTFTLAST